MLDQNSKTLFQNKNFLRLWLAQILSQCSIQIITFYILNNIFARTGSNLAVSFMWVAGSLPALMFGPFSGAIVDNFSRRRLLTLSAFLQSLVVGLLLFSSGRRVFILYFIVFLYWLLDQIYYPSQQALAPNLVNKQYLPTINGLFLLTQQVSIIIGFGLGGIMLTFLGSSFTIIIVMINLLLAAFVANQLPKDEPKRGYVEKDVAKFFQDFADGYHFVRTHRSILVALSTIIMTQVIITIISTSLPAFSQQVLNIDLNHASFALIVPAALGALSGTLLLPKSMKKFSHSQLISFFWFLGSISLISLSLITFLPAFRILATVIIAIVLGVSATGLIVPAQSQIQLKTPEDLRGRVYGQLGFLLILATTVPLIGAAALADILGISALVGAIGLVLLAGLIFALFGPKRLSTIIK